MIATLPDNKIALSIAESAQALGIGRTKMTELINGHEVRSVRIGRRVLVPRSALEEFLDRKAAP